MKEESASMLEAWIAQRGGCLIASEIRKEKGKGEALK